MSTSITDAPDEAAVGAPLAPTARPPHRRRPLRRDPLFLLSVTVLGLILLTAIAAPLIAPDGPNVIDIDNLEAPPSAEHLLGTDALGRDILARVLYGGRVSVLVGICAVLLQIVIGVSIGSLAGYAGGLVDTVLMRFTEIVMCFPFYAIAITLAAIFGASTWNVVLIIGVLNWTGLARLVRAELLSLREREFVLAARSIGVNPFVITLRHLLRNAYGPILVNATIAVGGGILAEAALSFLGLGVAQPNPSWGNMLSSAQSLRVLSNQWWMWAPPGIAIVLMVLSINVLGESLASRLNPQHGALLRDLRRHPRLPGLHRPERSTR